ncbi:hypothetical protein L0V05_06455 [Tabrizicola sp. J26]|uniref:hypothetical protein n=1 Tax=Alitabrizicola rongguiensis TaxID=2909234 RepID=UPI001F15EAC8|nr:hypothetical protein [Tabrizicola rongguiensis]MCF1708454.1 hypothetical protein [Tabrizicola rongguiensis]
MNEARPRPPPRHPVPAPPFVATADEAARLDAFRLAGGLCDAWFERGSDVLFVTFDNLLSFGEYDPPQPWLRMRVRRQGFSVLGILASRKDWYRNPDAPALIIALREAGLFEPFRRIVFAGSSMGGFAALTLSSLLPGSTVLAFSPQTTLSRTIAPFERRYPRPYRKFDWTTPAFLDARVDATVASRIWLLYDPFEREDAAHAARLADLEQVRAMRFSFFGHGLVWSLRHCGMLDAVIGGVGRGDLDELALRRALRNRREKRRWQVTLFKAAEQRGHTKLLRMAKRRARRLANAAKLSAEAGEDRDERAGPAGPHHDR